MKLIHRYKPPALNLISVHLTRDIIDWLNLCDLLHRHTHTHTLSFKKKLSDLIKFEFNNASDVETSSTCDSDDIILTLLPSLTGINKITASQ